MTSENPESNEKRRSTRTVLRKTRPLTSNQSLHVPGLIRNTFKERSRSSQGYGIENNSAQTMKTAESANLLTAVYEHI